MIEEEAPEIFGHTIFCDDIRQEISGKWIYIGVYQGSLLLNSDFPQTLAKFCFSINMIMKRELAKPPIKLRIFVPGDDEAPSIEAELGETKEGGLHQAAAAASEALGIPTEDQIHTVFFANLVFENFVLKEAGRVRVRADIDGKRYKLGSLLVAKNPQATL